MGAAEIKRSNIITLDYSPEDIPENPSRIYFPSGMRLAGHFSKQDGSKIELTHEELEGISMMQYRWGSIKNPFPRGLPWRGQRTYDATGAVVREINPEDFELIEEKGGLAGKLEAAAGDLVQLIHFDNDASLNIVGFVTRAETPKVRISHLDPRSQEDASKRLPIWTDYIPGINARHGDKTFSLREFNAYRVLR